MLVLVKSKEGTVRVIESADVEEVAEPVRGIFVRIIDSAEYVFVKAEDQDKGCVELQNASENGSLNLTAYGVVEAETAELEKKEEVSKFSP